jgi:hypothetical protein
MFFADKTLEQIVHRGGNFVQQQWTRGRRLRPGEDQQLPHQSGRLYDGGADLIGVPPAAVASIHTCEQ